MAKAKSYRVLAPYITYGDTVVVQGDVASDVPAVSVKWLLEQGVIEVVEDADAPAPDAA